MGHSKRPLHTTHHDTAHVSHGSCSAAVSCSFFCNSSFFCFCCSISACTFPLHSVHGSLKAKVSEMVSALKLSDFTALLDTKTLSIFKHKIHAACSIQAAFAFCTRKSTLTSLMQTIDIKRKMEHDPSNCSYRSKAHLSRLFGSLRPTFFMLTSGLTPWRTDL